MDNFPAHPHPQSASHDIRPHADSAPQQQLQAVSLQDYEQLVTARACFVDFLLRHADAA